MPSAKHPGGTAKRSKSRFSFIGETVAELKKVTWLTRREAAYLTLLVLVVSISVGVVLGLIDWGFSGLINLILGR
jgi:preprotein translocase subunit SecE